MKDILKELIAEARWSDVVYALAFVGVMYVVCDIMSAVLSWAGVA